MQMKGAVKRFLESLEPHNDGLDFARGLITAGIISAGMWLTIFVILAAARRYTLP